MQVEWEKTFAGYGTGSDTAYSVKQLSDGGYIVAGSSSAGIYKNEYYIIKLDEAGNTAWEKLYGRAGYDEGGWEYGEIWLAEELPIPIIVGYEEGHDEFSNDYAHSISATNDRGYIVTGASTGLPGELIYSYHNYILKLDMDGEIESR